MHQSHYLFFTTTCEQALAFYTQCGLGQVVEVLRYCEGNIPANNEAMRGKIMHAKFEGRGVLFYASDNDDAEPMRGSAHILMMDDREQTDRLFGLLGSGGRVTTPLGVQPWGGDYYLCRCAYDLCASQRPVRWFESDMVDTAGSPSGTAISSTR